MLDGQLAWVEVFRKNSPGTPSTTFATFATKTHLNYIANGVHILRRFAFSSPSKSLQYTQTDLETA